MLNSRHVAKGPHPKRRMIAICALVLTLLLSVIASGPHRALAAANTTADQFANVELPGDLGQTGTQFWVPETGQSIRGYFLDYWRANGAASVYGYPISEPFASPDGRYSQAFERGVFEFIPELIWTDEPSVSLMPIGEAVVSTRVGDLRRDGRRADGGGDRRSYAYRDVPPASDVVNRALADGGIYSETTAQTLSGSFYDWYATHEGDSYLGEPVTQPFESRGGVVQYFDGGALFRAPGEDVRLLPIVRENARSLGIDTSSVDRGDLPIFDELAFWKADNPNPHGDPYASGRKWIEISISQQMLWAYQGSTLISSTFVSTGIDPNHTELGVFHVRYKLEAQDMAGAVDANGAVVAMGQEAADAAGSSGYVVEDVPNVMYINQDAEALHGAYWHNNFGNPMSHGCINLPVPFSEFLYGWAPLGTMVWVHE
jgi:L,D-transpeptidase catalytic domain